MKLRTALVMLVLAAAAPARATLYTYDFTGINTTIPDNDSAGFSDTRTLSGMTGTPTTTINDVNVTLNISGGYNGDLYGYLVHDSGFAILLNRVGRTSTDSFGYSDSGFNITLDDSATTDIHLYGGNGGSALTGTWKPDGRDVDPNLVLDTSPRTALLSSFNGLDPNGAWTLFLADAAGGDESVLVSWSLGISVVPEPTEWAMIIFAALAVLYKFVLPRLRQLRLKPVPVRA